MTFDIATANGTATASSDYTARSLTGQTIPAGSSTFAFMVLVNGDTTPETNETFFVNVTNVTGATVADGQGQGTIVNDDVSADLSITKTDGVTTVVPGGSVTYTITASNAGPSDALGATVADTFPAALTATWTCVGAGGGTCTASGSGNINDTVNLPAGGSVTYTASATVSASATGTLSNTATVAAPGGVADPTPGDNSATDTDTLSPSADVSITKSDSPDPATAGTNLTYTITVANAGPSSAASVSLADILPVGMTFVSLASPGGWSCTTPAVGAGGTVSCSIVSLGVASAAFTLTVAVDPSLANGTTITNDATVSSTTADPITGNNTDTEDTSVSSSADLSVTKTDAPDSVTAGANLTYTITVTNAGPGNAAGVGVADALPAGTTFVSLASPGGWSCTTPAVGATGIATCSLPSMAPGSASFTLALQVDPSAAPASTITNSATVSADTPDPGPGDESATATTTVNGSADLEITKTDGVTTVTPGGPVAYTIVVSNAGPSTAADATVTDMFPTDVTGVTWTCAPAGGATCGTPNGSGSISTTVTLPPGGTATFLASGTVAMTAGASLANTASVTAPAVVADPNPANNTATDTDTVTPTSTPTVTPTGTPTPTGTLGPLFTSTPSPTGTPTPTLEATTTPTATPTSTTSTPTTTPSATATTAATSTPTVTATATVAPVQVNQPENEEDSPRPKTEEQRQQEQHTNAGNRDDVYTEGNVVEVHQDAQPPYVVIANRDGLVRVNLLCGSRCPTIRAGDYLEADGEKQTEALFDATDVSVTRSP